MSSLLRPASRTGPPGTKSDPGLLRTRSSLGETEDSNVGQQRLLIAGNTINSMSRMRKPWLRTTDTPKELRLSLGSSSPGRGPPNSNDPISSSNQTNQLEATSHLSSLEALGIELDGIESVDRERMQQLEATFLQGLGDYRSSDGEDLSFLNDSDAVLASMAGATDLRSNTENIPPLNLPKTSGTKRIRKSTTAAHSRPEQSKAGRDDLQPFLGAKLKKNLGKLGLSRQQLSLEPDEWDNESTINMLGSNFGSKEEERLKKHEQWYNKNLGPVFMKKRAEAQQREGEKKFPGHHAIKRLSSHGRLSLVVANQDDWRTSKTRSLLSKGSAQLLIADPGDDISVADLIRSRSHDHKAGSAWPRHESSRTSLARSGSCPPLLAPNARDRLRLSTRFLNSRGQICKASASKVFSQDFSQENLQTWSRSGEYGNESLDSSMRSHAYANVPRPENKQQAHERPISPTLNGGQPGNTLPSSAFKSSRPPTPEADALVSRHAVYQGLHGTQQAGINTSRGDHGHGHGGKENQIRGHPRVKKKRGPSHLLVDEVSSWNIYSPGREEMTPLDTLIQEKEGHYIRSPTKNFDIHEADLLREMRAKNITLSPATRMQRENPGNGTVDYLPDVNTAHVNDSLLDEGASPEPTKASVSSPDSRLLEQPSTSADSPFSKLRMESIMKKAVNEHPAFAESLPDLEDDAVGNCF